MASHGSRMEMIMVTCTMAPALGEGDLLEGRLQQLDDLRAVALPARGR